MRYIFLLVCLISTLNLCAQEKQIRYLSGTDNTNTVDWEFFCTGGRNSGYWTKIPVPSHWEQQGFGSYNYGRDYKTNGKNFRFADEKGLYRHHFTVPADWKNKKVFIVFEGSMTDTEVQINGQSAGPVHQGAFYRFKYDISDKLKFGSDNLLEVTVSKMSSEKSVNNAERLADYWVLGGIFRPVYLEALPQQHIDYVAIDAKADGDFSMQVHLRGITGNQGVQAEITDASGKTVATIRSAVRAGDSLLILKTAVKNVKNWTPETPHLYHVRVSLIGNGKTLYTIKERFGFRTIEVRRGEGIFVNGVQVKMKGVNRHVWWPNSGRCVNPAIDLMDVQLIREMNMNAVRCSHYPPDKSFLNYCDSLGLFVLNELAGWQKAYSTAAGKPLVREMVLRDLNHPSVIFWCNGNEGGTNKELDGEFERWDFSKRPVIHPHHRPGNSFNGIDCDHYEDYYSTKRKLSDTLIYMPTEFLHSQDDGGGGAGMRDFWELHYNSPRSGGGFIWAFVDEAIVRTDMNNVLDANGLNANDGLVGPYREKEASFFALKEIFSPVQIAMDKIPSGFEGSIELENRYYFTNLSACTYSWRLVNYRKPWDLLAGYTVEKSGEGRLPQVAPGQKGRLKLTLPSGWDTHDALMLNVSGPDGKEIYSRTWPIAGGERMLNGILALNKKAGSSETSDSTIVLKGGEVTVILNRNTGMLKEVQNSSAGKLSFNNGPVSVHGSAVCTGSRIYTDGEYEVAEFRYTGALTTVRWKMNSGGWLALEYAYEANGPQPFAGISFSYPQNYMLGAKWLGKGPYRQWKNRPEGSSLNVWQNLYNNTQTGYSPLVFPEFKGYYGDISWMEFNTVEGKFYAASRQPDLYVRLFDFYALTGVKPHPALPPGDISFLDCIPPIGTKLALNINYQTSSLGPRSEPTELSGMKERTLYFYFGLPKTTNSRELYSRPEIDEVF